MQAFRDSNRSVLSVKAKYHKTITFLYDFWRLKYITAVVIIFEKLHEYNNEIVNSKDRI